MGGRVGGVYQGVVAQTHTGTQGRVAQRLKRSRRGGWCGWVWAGGRPEEAEGEGLGRLRGQQVRHLPQSTPACSSARPRIIGVSSNWVGLLLSSSVGQGGGVVQRGMREVDLASTLGLARGRCCALGQRDVPARKARRGIRCR
jgi:hypothetical protein